MKKIKNLVVFIPLLITVLLVVIGISVVVKGRPNEIRIYTSADFSRFIEHYADNAEKKATLFSNIELAKPFIPSALACEFDGNGHTVKVTGAGALCLFDTVTETGSVKNLVLTGKLGSTDKQVVAGICISNLGKIENCSVNADFSGGGFVSGICHTNSGIITNCFVQSNKKDFGYIWNPICAESGGSVKAAYYSDTSSGENKTAGTFVAAERIKAENLIATLNEYTADKVGLIGWETDKTGYPRLKSDDSKMAASVFSGSTAVLLVCIILMIVAVPIITIIYVDKQKKKVIYNIAGKGE